MNWDKNSSASHGKDIKPKEATQLDSGEVLDSESDEDNTPDPKPPESKTKSGLTILKPIYINPGMDTKNLVVPRTPMVTRSKGKLMLDNNATPLNDIIETFVRSRKKPYKEIKYKDSYRPDEFKEPIEQPSPWKSARLDELKPRRSAKLKANFTKGEPSRTKLCYQPNLDLPCYLP